MREALPAAPGTYLLLMACRETGTVSIGAAGELRLARGYYLYVGSACGPGGLRARVSRHLLGGSRPHWHIDYLRRRIDPVAAYFRGGRARREHRWSRRLAAMPALAIALPRFGASDCRCPAHLFYAPTRPSPRCLGEWVGEDRLSVAAPPFAGYRPRADASPPPAVNHCGPVRRTT
jgi:Uri superfamily endonuclease